MKLIVKAGLARASQLVVPAALRRTNGLSSARATARAVIRCCAWAIGGSPELRMTPISLPADNGIALATPLTQLRKQKAASFMITTRLAIAAALVMGAVQPASASVVFNFSYNFGTSNHTVTGAISGTRNDNGTPGNLADDFVQGVTVLSAFYDGVAFSGPVLTLSFYDHNGLFGGPTTMAFAAMSNNFLLGNCDSVPSCTAGYADANININYFLLRTPGQGGTAAQFYSESAGNTREDPVNAAGWSLVEQAVSNNVPEPGSYALVSLGLGALGLMQRRRRVRN